VEYLAAGDLTRADADLSSLRWRCRDLGFFLAATAALRARHVWSKSIWSEALDDLQRSYCSCQIGPGVS
jgi:hypothetical protein